MQYSRKNKALMLQKTTNLVHHSEAQVGYSILPSCFFQELPDIAMGNRHSYYAHF